MQRITLNSEIIHEWRNANGDLHRDNLPARTAVCTNDTTRYIYKEWWQNGRLHRSPLHGVTDPARILYYDDGNVQRKEWWINGEIRRNDDLPSVVSYYDEDFTQEWMVGYEHQRNCGLPHIVVCDRDGTITQQTWINGHEYYTTTYFNGILKMEEWWLDGERRHRAGNLPAVMIYNYGDNGNQLYQKWYVNGVFVREEIV